VGEDIPVCQIPDRKVGLEVQKSLSFSCRRSWGRDENIMVEGLDAGHRAFWKGVSPESVGTRKIGVVAF
jgi:hypothetical protein